EVGKEGLHRFRDLVVVRRPRVDLVGGEVSQRVLDLGGMRRTTRAGWPGGRAGARRRATRDDIRLRPRVRVEITINRLLTGLAVKIAPLPGTVGDEPVAREVRRRLPHFVRGRAGIDLQRIAGAIAVNILQRLREILGRRVVQDRKSTRLNSSHGSISYAVFCLKKKTT